MKLRQKLALVSVLLTAAVTVVCTVRIAAEAAESNLALVVSHHRADQSVRAVAWADALSATQRREDRETARRSLARYYARQYGDDGTVLLSDGYVLINGTSVAPEELLTLEQPTEDRTWGSQSHTVWTAGERRLLVVGSAYRIEGDVYSFYQLSDITDVYSGIRRMVLRFAAVDGAVILLSALLTVLLVGRMLRPLEELQAGAERIAAGVYDRRVRVKSRDEIGALAADFNDMADAVEGHILALREEAERQTMLLAALTHELKTPMTGIRGNAETLLMTRLSEEEQQEALIFIDSECTRMERLSQKLMTLISLRKEGALRLTACNVDELFAEVEASCAGQLRARGLTLETENRMETVQGEPDLLASLLINLIDNAGKASAPGGVIRLTARDGCLSVRDFGCGMEREELSKITQPFYMADKSRSRKAGGVGLGLALCAEIAALHRAELSFDSTPGEGTTAKLQFAYDSMRT